jgi:hypothetical protein
VPVVTEGFNPETQIRFSLSPSEAGLLLHQLPDYPVELVRRLPVPGEAPGSAVVYNTEMPNKVLRVTPRDGVEFVFTVDYEKDGVGGQHPSLSSTEAPPGPLEVVVQVGDYQVLREILRSSIPALTGFSTLMDVAVQKVIHDAIRNSRGGQFGADATNHDAIRNSRGGQFGADATNDLPF